MAVALSYTKRIEVGVKIKRLDCIKYALLRKKYGQWASWAIWNPADITDLAPVITYPAQYNYTNGQAASYRNDLVIVGLNAVKSISPWQNFHCRYRGCRDTYLRAAFNKPCTGGAYVTDFVKNFLVVKSTDVLAKLKDKKFLSAQVAGFSQEFDDLWSGTTFDDCPPLIITLGKVTHDLFREHFALCKAVGKYKPQVLCVPHHASRGATERVYDDSVAQVLKSWKEAYSKDANH